ncbi:hypothetical protein HKX48_003271 [Thoreauomyces humboldtii]|nr:hypothetical protein HKX48_003271 [Thoreauomyces humboldtii]
MSVRAHSAAPICKASGRHRPFLVMNLIYAIIAATDVPESSPPKPIGCRSDHYEAFSILLPSTSLPLVALPSLICESLGIDAPSAFGPRALSVFRLEESVDSSDPRLLDATLDPHVVFRLTAMPRSMQSAADWLPDIAESQIDVPHLLIKFAAGRPSRRRALSALPPPYSPLEEPPAQPPGFLTACDHVAGPVYQDTFPNPLLSRGHPCIEPYTLPTPILAQLCSPADVKEHLSSMRNSRTYHRSLEPPSPTHAFRSGPDLHQHPTGTDAGVSDSVVENMVPEIDGNVSRTIVTTRPPLLEEESAFVDYAMASIPGLLGIAASGLLPRPWNGGKWTLRKSFNKLQKRRSGDLFP